MILKKDQIEDIVQRLDFIKIQLSDLEKFSSLTWKKYQDDRDVQRNIERLVENVANASIDVSKILLAGEEVEMPNSYKDIILKLGTIKVLDAKESEKLADYASLRNVLAHQYLDIKWDKIKYFIANAVKDYAIFIKKLADRIKSK